MDVATYAANTVPPHIATAWSELVRDRALSPFMSPGFAVAVQRARGDSGGDVRVVLAFDRGQLMAAWPMQRRHRMMAEPVGFGLADFQGMVVAPGHLVTPEVLLRKAGNLTYDFDHLVDPEGNFASSSDSAVPSPFIDVDQTFAEYSAMLRRRGSTVAAGIRRKQRRLEREVGPISFCHDTGSSADLADLLVVKRAQYLRTGRRDALEDPWRQRLLTELLTSSSPDCRGVMSVLKANGQTIAWHFGLRNQAAFHWWFPAYAAEFGAYSPGLLLLNEIIAHECAADTRRIDLGTGDSDYKTRLATGASIVYQGSVAANTAVSLGRMAVQRQRSAGPPAAVVQLRRSVIKYRDRAEAKLFHAVVSVETAAPLVALTFDDGPTPGLTEHIGARLAESGHLATFFVLTPRAIANPLVIRELVSQGHQIGLHGVEHERLSKYDGGQLLTTLRRAKSQLEDLTGCPVSLLRPPYGAQSRKSYAITRLARLTPVGWSDDGVDYLCTDVSDVLVRLGSGLRAGAVVLLHDGGGEASDGLLPEDVLRFKLSTADAVIDLLTERGLRSTTMEHLMGQGAVITKRWIRGNK